MGYYIQTDCNKGKADEIIAKHGGREVGVGEAKECLASAAEAPILILDNGPFEAACFLHSAEEFEYFQREAAGGDHRPRRFVVMDRTKCEQLAGYVRE